jgi:hypothetical protein
MVRHAFVIVILQGMLLRFRAFVLKKARLIRIKWGIFLTIKAFQRVVKRRYGRVEYIDRIKKQTKMVLNL